MLGGYLDIVFFTLAGIFAGLFWRERRRQPERLSPAGRTWLRIAAIFFAVALFLLWQLRFAAANA